MSHDLELLLSLHGETFVFEGGYRVKYVTHRVPKTAAKPHGIDYSLTLHAPNGKRLLGFDNAHPVKTGRGSKAQVAADHWHRDESDEGRPYPFTTAAKLLEDFHRNVDRILVEQGVKK